MRPKRSLAREIGNPLTMFHDKEAGGRDVKWSMFRVILWGLFLAFLYHFPVEWSLWSWATLATIALAIAVRDLIAMVPVKEGLLALAALFGGAIGKRVTKSTTVEEVSGPAVEPAPRVPEANP